MKVTAQSNSEGTLLYVQNFFVDVISFDLCACHKEREKK